MSKKTKLVSKKLKHVKFSFKINKDYARSSHNYVTRVLDKGTLVECKYEKRKIRLADHTVIEVLRSIGAKLFSNNPIEELNVCENHTLLLIVREYEFNKFMEKCLNLDKKALSFAKKSIITAFDI